ncbi:MAG: scoA [Firmicutes bacterium]|nr:scoA [Bacillota bacterium]
MAKIKTLHEVLNDLKSNSSIMIGGFGNIGNPKAMIDLIADSDLFGLTIIANDLGTPNVGLGRLVTKRKISKAIGTYFTYNPEAAQLYFEGKLDLEMVPQGTFAEAIRAGGCGIGGFYTPVGVGTELAKDTECREIDGKKYVLVRPIRADYAILHAKKADELGNLIYEKTARNFNPLMAMAADYTIVEVDDIVPAGSLSPEEIVTPFIYVDALIPMKRGDSE